MTITTQAMCIYLMVHLLSTFFLMFWISRTWKGYVIQEGHCWLILAWCISSPVCMTYIAITSFIAWALKKARKWGMVQ